VVFGGKLRRRQGCGSGCNVGEISVVIVIAIVFTISSDRTR
jgi:hypothetical protein